MIKNPSPVTQEIEFIFRVKKLGKKGFSHKPRILLINRNGITYYAMIEKNSATEGFLRDLQSNTINVVGEEYNEDTFFQLASSFRNLPQKYIKEKGHFDDYEVEKIDKISSFDKCPVKITNNDKKDEGTLGDVWYLETYKETFRDAIMRAKDRIIENSKQINMDESQTNNEKDNTNQQNNQTDEQKNKEKYIKTEFKEKDKIHFIEIMYQKYFKEYLDVLKKSNKDREDNIKHQFYLELALYYCYRLFVAHCEKIVKKIIFDLSTFEKADVSSFQRKVHPIVFPNPYYFSQENNSVLLYSIWGVNYTLTWNHLRAKFTNSFNETKGKWKGLKHQFKQKDYFQNFIMKIASVADNTEELPTVPMNCIIDYNGFRILCESDILGTEESIEGYRLKNSAQQNQMESSFVKDLAKTLSEVNEKGKKIENVNIVYEISPKDVADEKNFDLSVYINTMNKDFEMSFERTGTFSDANIIIQNSELRKADKVQIIQTEKQFLKCINKIYFEDKGDLKPYDLTFDKFDSPISVNSLLYRYLMHFDILIPNSSDSNKKVYYRQELVINRLSLEPQEINEIIELHSNSRPNKTSISNVNINTNQKDDNELVKLKEKEKYLLNIFKNNTYQNNPTVKKELTALFNKKLDTLLLVLDSMYLIPYNSETLKICFHYYGINLHFLGKVAERTRVPHIRELCVIEMFARVCKKIVFDLLAQSTFDKAMGAFYAQTKELTTTLNNVPVCFNLIYGNDYLKSITQPVERVKFPMYNGVEVTGLYLTDDDYPIKDQKDNKEKKEIFEFGNSQIKYQLLSNFFTILFADPNTKANFELYGRKITSTQALWDFIIELIIEKYEIIETNDVFLYCKLETMPIFALVSAIQYHTGIKFQNGLSGLLEKVNSQKFDTAVFESISPNVKSSYYSFAPFICKQGVALPLMNNFGMYYPSDQIYYEAKLNYYAEKYLYRRKIAHNYYYLYYLKILKSWDTEKKIKRSFRDNYPKEFDKNVIVTDNVPVQMNPVFEENFDIFIGLLYSQYQPKSLLKNAKNEQIRETQKSDTNYLYTCERIISMYWNPKHPFLAILKTSFAKAMYKNTNNRKEETKIFTLLKSAVEIAKDSLGELNIYYGKVARDAGMFFDKNLKFSEASNMYLIAYRVFKTHKKLMKKDYFYSLKYLTKSYVYLGDLDKGLKFGVILVNELYEDRPPTPVDSNQSKDNDSNVPNITIKRPNYWDILHNMTGFTLNLMKIAKNLMKYDIGVKMGNIFFELIPDYNRFSINPFKNWMKTSDERVKEMINIKNEQNNKGEYRYNTEIRLKEYELQFNLKEKRIDNVIKVYLKCLFNGLNGIEHKTFANAYIYLTDNYKNGINKNNVSKVNEEFYKLFFRKTGETFEEYFKTNILYYLTQKFEMKKYGDEMNESIRKAVHELKIIYYKFHDSKMFKM